MSRLLFPSKYLTNQNQALLIAIQKQFGVWDGDTEITIDIALEDLEYSYLFDGSVIDISTDEYYDFEDITTELIEQKIPYDLKHASDYDSNTGVELYRPDLITPRFINTDYFYNPAINIKDIRDILDNQDENLSDSDLINLLIDKINWMDFDMEGNRIQDFA